MESTLYEKYRQHRRECPWLPAKTAHYWARQPQPSAEARAAIDEALNCRKKSWTANGLIYTLKLEEDQDGDTGWLGEIRLRSWAPGAIRLPGGFHLQEMWYHPARKLADEYRELRKTRTRHDAYVTAHAEIREDLDRLLKYRREWHLIGIVVEAAHPALPDIVLGTASLWGIESDVGEDYLAQTADELIREATWEAQRNMHTICATV